MSEGAQGADILVVDDETEIVQLIHEVLSDEGYQVRRAFDGVTALAEIDASPPRLVLLDYSMPRMTGGEVLAQLRSNGYNTLPIVIMSASSSHASLEMPGASAFLEKPFDLDDLIACVERFTRDS
jgi:CheY-like chemotaxis protein